MRKFLATLTMMMLVMLPCLVLADNFNLGSSTTGYLGSGLLGLGCLRLRRV